jgi:hypothetical protein
VGSLFKYFNGRKDFAFEEFKEGTTACGDVTHFVSDTVLGNGS